MTTKTEIKRQLKEELKCPTDFIERCLNKSEPNLIDSIKNAEHETDRQFFMNMVYDEWREYCKEWDLDPDGDNSHFKPKLWKV